MPSLVVLVVRDVDRLSPLLSAWCDIGVPGVTIIDSMGASSAEGRHWCEALPILPSLRDLLTAGETPRKTIFSVVPDDLVDSMIRLTTEIVGDLSEPGVGVLFVVPVARALGRLDNRPP